MSHRTITSITAADSAEQAIRDGRITICDGRITIRDGRITIRDGRITIRPY